MAAQATLQSFSGLKATGMKASPAQRVAAAAPRCVAARAGRRSALLVEARSV